MNRLDAGSRCSPQAQAAGEISVEHARVVVRTIEKLPASLREHGPAVEQVLTDAAREFAPAAGRATR